MTADDAPTGYIKLARKAFDADHGDSFWLERREFSRFEAWVFVIQLACYAAYRHQTAFGAVELERGEFVASRRWLAGQWHWSEKRVRIWIEKCEKGARLRAQRETAAGTVYLIVNYERYQGEGPSKGPAKVTAEGQAGAQQGPKREAGKASKAITTSSSSPDEQRVFEYFLARHPRRRIGDKDRRSVAKALTSGYSAAELCTAIDGNASDAWHISHHKHELSYVVRDDKLDTFIASGTPVALVDPATGLLTSDGAQRMGKAS